MKNFFSTVDKITYVGSSSSSKFSYKLLLAGRPTVHREYFKKNRGLRSQNSIVVLEKNRGLRSFS